MSLALVALLVACVALGLAVRTYIGYQRLRRAFEGYDSNPVYGSRHR